jgi:ABC-type multidrug transport system fused ATPase/permease subunit
LVKGQKIAFVGKSGSGKSTLVDLLCGLLKPSEGEITVNGVSLRGHENEWTNLIGYVPQTIFIMDGTIKDNILFGEKYGPRSDKRLADAIRASQLESYVSSIPEGVEALTGDKGLRLSGGERQRIGVARSVFKKGELLILDEGTSALDNITESNLVRSVTENSGYETIIFIAHRLSSVKNVDLIYIVDNGKIVASGTYEQLEKNSALFRNMLSPSENAQQSQQA